MSVTKLESILARLSEQERSKISIMPLAGGMTNVIYRLDRGDEAFILRVFGENTEVLGINRDRERICTSLAAEIGIGAEVVPWIPGDDILVTRFIEGKPLTVDNAKLETVIEKIVSSIRLVHNGPKFPGVFSAFKDIRAYCELAKERGLLLPENLPETLEQLALIEKVIGVVADPKSCHNDLLASNFIDDGKLIRIIDWEYAAMGDPFFDLGFFAADSNFDDAECEFLLNCYFGEVRTKDLAHLHLMRLVSELRETFCPYVLSTISKLNVDYMAYANRRYERYLSEASTPNFQKWLNEVA